MPEGRSHASPRKTTVPQIPVSEIRLAEMLQTTRAELVVARGQIAEAVSERVTAQTNSTSTLQALTAKETAYQQVLAQLGDAEQTRNEALDNKALAEKQRNRMKRDLDVVQNELTDAQKEYKGLGEKYASLELWREAVATKLGPDLVLTLVPQIDARVDAVDNEQGLVVLSAGEHQQVKTGYKFTVFRDDQLVGQVQVTKVFGDLAGASVLYTHNGARIRRGDKATTQP